MRELWPKITVVLADRHNLVREGIRLLLEAESGISVLGEASDGPQALALVKKLRPKVLIACVEIQGLSGFELTRQAVAHAPSTRVVMLSKYRSADYVTAAFRCGALGYVIEESSAADLIRAVRKVAAGRHYLSPQLGAIEGYDRKAGTGDRGLRDILTEREREVLHLVAEGLSGAVMGRRLGISPRTAEAHRANVIRKLGLRGRTDLIRYALQHGILPL